MTRYELAMRLLQREELLDQEVKLELLIESGQRTYVGIPVHIVGEDSDGVFNIEYVNVRKKEQQDAV